MLFIPYFEIIDELTVLQLTLLGAWYAPVNFRSEDEPGLAKLVKIDGLRSYRCTVKFAVVRMVRRLCRVRVRAEALHAIKLWNPK